MSFLPPDGWQLIPHQVLGHLFAFLFSAQSPLPAVGLAPLMEKTWNDWMPVKQAQLSGSEVGPRKALTAKTCSDVRVHPAQPRNTSQPANKSLNNGQKIQSCGAEAVLSAPYPLSSNRTAGRELIC